MLIETTIYLTELKDLHRDDTEQPAFALQPSADRTRKLFRELLSLFESRNRILPIDRNN